MAEGSWKDPLSRRLARRAVTIPLYFALSGLSLGLLPITLPAAAVADLLRRDRFVLARCVLFFQWYLLCEVAGILRVAVEDETRVGRLSDDDFGIFLPNAGRGEARQMAAGLRSAVESYRFFGYGPDAPNPRVTVKGRLRSS